MDWGFVMFVEVFCVLPGLVLDYRHRREEYHRWWAERPRWKEG